LGGKFYDIDNNQRLTIITDSKIRESFYYHLPWINNYERGSKTYNIPGTWIYDDRETNTNQTYIWIDNNIENYEMRKIALHIVLIPFLFGCAKSQEDLSGTYIKIPSTNTIDTLFLYPDGNYKQVIYYKSGEFYGLNENKWSVKEGRIDFMDLYLNYDFELLSEAKPKAGYFQNHL